jgi:hypothetical protein
MAAERGSDLQSFRTFIDEQLATGNAELGPDEALALWRHGYKRAQDEPTLASTTLALQANPGEWARRLQEWVDSLPVRPSNMDDSRESIYAGRGE